MSRLLSSSCRDKQACNVTVTLEPQHQSCITVTHTNKSSGKSQSRWQTAKSTTGPMPKICGPVLSTSNLWGFKDVLPAQMKNPNFPAWGYLNKPISRRKKRVGRLAFFRFWTFLLIEWWSTLIPNRSIILISNQKVCQRSLKSLGSGKNCRVGRVTWTQVKIHSWPETPHAQYCVMASFKGFNRTSAGRKVIW